jgi:hypothetical protein
MYLLGHTDPKFTMRVYQQVLDLGGAHSEQLELVLGCKADEAFCLLSGREPRTPVRLEVRPRNAESPANARLSRERLKGFEP